jgi:hypothetical protein
LSDIEKQDEETLLSAMHKLSKFEGAFKLAHAEREIYNIFINTFDAESHQGNNFVHKRLPDTLWAFSNQNDVDGVYALKEDGKRDNNPILALYYLLRVLKFFTEKSGGEL